jgi:hypothetical protein
VKFDVILIPKMMSFYRLTNEDGVSGIWIKDLALENMELLSGCIYGGWVPGVLSPGLKHGRGVTLNTHPHLVLRSRMSRSYTASPPKRLHGV